MMGKSLIRDAQESVGGVKLSNLERKQHFYWSPHVVKDAESNDGLNLRWSSRAHWRIVVPFRAWIAERYESSVENRRPTVGQ